MVVGQEGSVASKEERSILEITGRTSSQQISVIGGTGENKQCMLRLENAQEIRAQAQPHTGLLAFPRATIFSASWRLHLEKASLLDSPRRNHPLSWGAGGAGTGLAGS